MKSLLTISVILVTIVAPIVAARASSARRGLKTLLVFLLLFDAAYVFTVAYYFAAHFRPEDRF